MQNSNNDPYILRRQIEDFCAKIGKNKLFVQGAGGNVSWKINETLWVKASGKWLGKNIAKQENLFTCLKLGPNEYQKFSKNPNLELELCDCTHPRPSIETPFHALLPQRIVCHLHEVRTTSILVQTNAEAKLSSLIPRDLNWKLIPYVKPGVALAQEIKVAFTKNPTTDVYFLANHGIIVVAEDVSSIEKKLFKVTDAISAITEKIFIDKTPPPKLELIKQMMQLNYNFLKSESSISLSFNNWLLENLSKFWPICPDTIVFLGSAPPKIFDSSEVLNYLNSKKTEDKFILVRNFGIFFKNRYVSEAELEQFQFMTDLLIRVPTGANITTLKPNQISELVNWDAEKYRQKLN